MKGEYRSTIGKVNIGHLCTNCLDQLYLLLFNWLVFLSQLTSIDFMNFLQVNKYLIRINKYLIEINKY